jgi:hypothetical protein
MLKDDIELERERPSLWQGLEFVRERSSFLHADGKPSHTWMRQAGFIDCGEAGKIELFTAARIDAACEQSGCAKNVDLLRHLHDAPIVAHRVLHRAKARAEQIERETEQMKRSRRSLGNSPLLESILTCRNMGPVNS